MTAPEFSWTLDDGMRRALAQGITAIAGRCDKYDPDCLIGALVEHGYCIIIPAPEPLGPPRAGGGS